jgi:D-alanine-D-alanine ligase
MQHELTTRPYVLKPCDGGSSLDTFIVRNPQQANTAAMEHAFDTYQEMLLEELISGSEITVAILGEQALPVIEIIPPADEEFDYENKYNGKTQEICPPQHLPEAVQHQAQQLALHIHTLIGCSGMSRTDMILDAQDRLFVLETNTIPGLTDQSLLPKAALQADIPMPQLVEILIEDALTRA